MGLKYVKTPKMEAYQIGKGHLELPAVLPFPPGTSKLPGSQFGNH